MAEKIGMVLMLLAVGAFFSLGPIGGVVLFLIGAGVYLFL